jgi:hypothetical protein
VFDRKVYVSVYADGPTKVLCFSDDPLWTGSSEADEGGDAQQLLSRLHHMARQLLTVDRQLELYQGAAYGLKPGRGSRAVPALLLLQHQQLGPGGHQLRRGSVASGGGAAAAEAAAQPRQQQVPLLLQGAVDGVGAAAGSTAAAALALLQHMAPPGAALQQSKVPAVGRGSVTAVGMRSSEVSLDVSWPGAAAAAALGIGGMSYGPYGHIDGVRASEVFAQPALHMSPSPQTVLPPSHVSSRPLAGAAAAAAAGVRVAGGMLGAEGGVEGGVKLYYDKLTLLLDSQLPLGGNVKVNTSRSCGASVVLISDISCAQ